VILFAWIYKLSKNIQSLEIETSDLKTLVASLVKPSQAYSQENIKEADKNIAESYPSQPAIINQETITHITPNTDQKKKESTKNDGFEKRWGLRLPVWIGGISLALSGFFLVKYSLDNDLLSPTVRTIFGMIFGILLIYGAKIIRSKENIGNVMKIAQSLSGAGIAVLYVCVFASCNIYNLVPMVVGFIGMGIVTALAVLLSLAYGYSIALLGLIGGFITPALFSSSSPSAPLLFMYLYVLLTGIFVVIRREKWWLLAIPTVLGAFLWVIFWIISCYSAHDSIYLGLFLISLSATFIVTSNKQEDIGNIFGKASILNYITLGGTSILIAATLVKSQFGLLEWGMFWFISLAGIFLAHFNFKLYGFVPFVTLVTNILMLLFWQNQDQFLVCMILSSFALLYVFSGFFIFWISSNPVSWAIITCLSSLGFYLLAYYKLSYNMAVSQIAMFNNIPIWGILAITLSWAGVVIIKKIIAIKEVDEEIKQKLLAIFALSVTSFISLALTIELEKEFLSLVFASQVLAASWLNNLFNIGALRSIAKILACIFTFIILPQLLSLNLLVLDYETYLSNALPILKWPIIQLGLPGLMIMGASFCLRKQKDDQLVWYLEVGSIGLFALSAFYFSRYLFHPAESIFFAKLTFLQRIIGTNVILLSAGFCFWIKNKTGRDAYLFSGKIIYWFAFLRIIFFHLLIYNPLFSHQEIGSIFLINNLLLAYLTPLLMIYFINNKLNQTLKYSNILNLTLLFVFVSFNVCQFYHGAYLDTGVTSNSEIYTYSASWLLMGIGLLIYGTLKNDRTIRIASLIVMIITIGKVFLYDASALSGLYRIFSFLGLGLILLGLSYFYSRFVFKDNNYDTK
jgi:uncharacterized membrane protein